MVERPTVEYRTYSLAVGIENYNSKSRCVPQINNTEYNRKKENYYDYYAKKF